MAIDRNVLLVEGQDEVRTIPYLMGLNGIDWGKEKNTIVKLRDCKGYTNIIKASAIAWLAWQKPPGLQLHQAIKERILDPQHPEAQMFVNWFRKLYQP